MKPLALLAAALLLLSAAVPARALSPEDEKTVIAGMDALFRSDIDGAEKIFLAAEKQRPGSPALSLGYAITAWWRMEDDFAAIGSMEEKRFLDAVDGAIADAKKITDKKEDAEAYVCLGAAYGLRGRHEASNKHWFKAYRDGRRCYKDQSHALKLDPNLYDAYLGIGTFDYYTATLSRMVRMFVFTKGADKAQGLAEIELSQKGRFTEVAAKLLLVGLDWTFEKKPKEAWTILEELHGRYPGSPFIDSMRMIGLFHLRDAAGLQKEAKAYLEKADKGAPFFREIDKPAGHYFLGLGLQLGGKYQEALVEHRKALELIPEGHRTRGLPYLFIGECLDLLGKRDEAVASYKQALKEQSFWGVQRYAKHLLKHPYEASENPLPARNEELD